MALGKECPHPFPYGHGGAFLIRTIPIGNGGKKKKKKRKFSAIRFDLFCLKVVGGVNAYQADDQKPCLIEQMATLGLKSPK